MMKCCLNKPWVWCLGELWSSTHWDTSRWHDKRCSTTPDFPFSGCWYLITVYRKLVMEQTVSPWVCGDFGQSLNLASYNLVFLQLHQIQWLARSHGELTLLTNTQNGESSCGSERLVYRHCVDYGQLVPELSQTIL